MTTKYDIEYIISNASKVINIQLSCYYTWFINTFI